MNYKQVAAESFHCDGGRLLAADQLSAATRESYVDDLMTR